MSEIEVSKKNNKKSKRIENVEEEIVEAEVIEENRN